MARCLILILLAGTAMSQDTEVEPAKAKGTAKIAGLQIVHPPYGKEDELRAFYQQPGTAISLLLTVEEPHLIGLDEDASAITKFDDDKGTDLLAAKPRFSGILSPFPKFSKDGKACLVELRSGAVPAAGARTISIEGKLALTVAKGTDVKKSEKVEIKKGTEIKAGDIPWVIDKAGKPDWGEEPLSVTLKTEKFSTKYAGIRFLDADGNELETTPAGWSKGGTFANFTFNFKKDVKEFVVEISYWKDVTTKEVPFKVEAGLGF